MLIIRKAQLEAFKQGSFEGYVTELMDHCWAFSPHLCKTLRDDELRHAVQQGVRRAEVYGFTARGPVRLYVDMMILLGSGFDTDPQYRWAAEILARRDYRDQMDRAEALHARTQDYLAKVDGEDNVYTLRALSEFAELVRRGLSLQKESFERDILRLMVEMHPRKVEETGEASLQELIADGIARGEGRYGFQALRSLMLMVVLMFAFGHHVDADPLLPWIARVLRQPHEASPDQTAERLERRALIWLDAVLRNAKEGR